MFQLTERAAKELRRNLAEHNTPEDVCFRLGMSPEGPVLVFDEKGPEDTAVMYDHEALVVMDREVADHFDFQTMDYDETTQELVFT